MCVCLRTRVWVSGCVCGGAGGGECVCVGGGGVQTSCHGLYLCVV